MRPHRPPRAVDRLNRSFEVTSPSADIATPKNTTIMINQVLISTTSLSTKAPKIIENTGTVATAIKTIATGAKKIPYAKQKTFAI